VREIWFPSSHIFYFIETNNTDMLKVARAFEAELALRQGDLTMASRWLKEFHGKPFRPPFRFYMPQLTAVKIWLAQNTTDIRSQAADLLEQLHVFLESIHNNLFLIEALALQALLHDARGEDSKALKKLSHALAFQSQAGSYAFSWIRDPNWPNRSNS
jgi:hypothetical protein